MQPELELINQTLAVLTERTIDAGHCIMFKNNFYKTMDIQGLQTHYLKGTKGLVIQTFDKQLLFSVNDKIYELDIISANEHQSQSIPRYACLLSKYI